jgi:hypothetical protein
MSYYNGIIEICHLHTRSAIEKIINSFLLEDMDYLLKTEIESNWQYLYTPIDVFYHDCELIINKLEKSMSDESFGDISEEVDFIERMMKGRQKSFYLKIIYTHMFFLRKKTTLSNNFYNFHYSTATSTYSWLLNKLLSID